MRKERDYTQDTEAQVWYDKNRDGGSSWTAGSAGITSTGAEVFGAATSTAPIASTTAAKETEDKNASISR